MKACAILAGKNIKTKTSNSANHFLFPFSFDFFPNLHKKPYKTHYELKT